MRALVGFITKLQNLPKDGPLAPLMRIVRAPLVRYAGAGAVGTITQYVGLIALVMFLRIHPALASAIGAALGAIINYELNYYLTFRSHASHARTLPKFMTVAAITTTFNVVAMWFAVKHIRVHWLIAQFVITFIVLLSGFALNKAWTFGARSRSAARASQEADESQDSQAGPDDGGRPMAVD